MLVSRRAALAVPLLAMSARLAGAQAPVAARIGVIPILPRRRSSLPTARDG